MNIETFINPHLKTFFMSDDQKPQVTHPRAKGILKSREEPPSPSSTVYKYSSEGPDNTEHPNPVSSVTGIPHKDYFDPVLSEPTPIDPRLQKMEINFKKGNNDKQTAYLSLEQTMKLRDSNLPDRLGQPIYKPGTSWSRRTSQGPMQINPSSKVIPLSQQIRNYHNITLASLDLPAPRISMKDLTQGQRRIVYWILTGPETPTEKAERVYAVTNGFLPTKELELLQEGVSAVTTYTRKALFYDELPSPDVPGTIELSFDDEDDEIELPDPEDEDEIDTLEDLPVIKEQTQTPISVSRGGRFLRVAAMTITTGLLMFANHTPYQQPIQETEQVQHPYFIPKTGIKIRYEPDHFSLRRPNLVQRTMIDLEPPKKFKDRYKKSF